MCIFARFAFQTMLSPLLSVVSLFLPFSHSLSAALSPLTLLPIGLHSADRSHSAALWHFCYIKNAHSTCTFFLRYTRATGISFHTQTISLQTLLDIWFVKRERKICTNWSFSALLYITCIVFLADIVTELGSICGMYGRLEIRKSDSPRSLYDVFMVYAMCAQCAYMLRKKMHRKSNHRGRFSTVSMWHKSKTTTDKLLKGQLESNSNYRLKQNGRRYANGFFTGWNCWPEEYSSYFWPQCHCDNDRAGLVNCIWVAVPNAALVQLQMVFWRLYCWANELFNLNVGRLHGKLRSTLKSKFSEFHW